MRRLFPIFDLLSVFVFVAIGRRAHDHGITVGGIASTFWPFAVGTIVGWLILVRRKRTGSSLADGVSVAVVTVALGMLLRVVSGQGTAAAFVVVALVFVNLFMVGWRLLLRLSMRSRRGIK